MNRQVYRRGNATYTVLSLIAILGFGAVSVDLSVLRASQADLQNALDAAAMGAAGYVTTVRPIERTASTLATATSRAQHYGELNPVEFRADHMEDAEVTYGKWIEGEFVVENDPTEVTAVQVHSSLSGINTFFAHAAFGVTDSRVGASSIALVPPPNPATAVSCTLPIALADCHVEALLGAEATLDIQVTSSRSDNASWAVMDSMGSANASSFLDQVDPARAGNCEGAEISDEVVLNNGAVNIVPMTMIDVINEYDENDPEVHNPVDMEASPAWSSVPDISTQLEYSSISDARWGIAIEGPIMIFTSPDTNGNGIGDHCDDSLPGNYNGHEELQAFVWGAVYDIENHGSHKSMSLRLNSEFDFTDYATAGDGEDDYGLLYQPPPVMVR